MEAEYNSTTLAKLFTQNDAGNLRLPPFQRQFVWSLEQQRGLATSVLLNVPSGSLLLLRGSGMVFPGRTLGSRQVDELQEGHEYTFVLDGQQRLSTLYQVFADPLSGENWTTKVDQWYWRLRYRWALQIQPEEGAEDYFGYKYLNFTQLPTEPESIRDRLRELRINKTGKVPWYHPSKPATHANRLSQTSNASAHGLVPLWEVATPPSAENDPPLHQLTLQHLGEQRRRELEAEIKDGRCQTELLAALRRAQPFLAEEPTQSDLIAGLHSLAARWVETLSQFIGKRADYGIPYVEIGPDQLDRAVVIFEAMNKGGTPLATFDLITAKAAKGDLSESLADKLSQLVTDEKFELDELWGDNHGSKPASWSIDPAGGIALDNDELSVRFKNAFLNVMSLQFSHTQGIDALSTDAIKQKAILSMAPDAVLHYWPQAGRAVLRSWAFLQFRCGIRRESDLRNQLLLLPIALCLSSEDAFKDRDRLDRIEYWYWCSVLTGTYKARQNENAVNDAKNLLRWLDDNIDDPFSARFDMVLADPQYSDEKTLLRTDEEAGVSTDVDKYLLQYVLSRCPRDLLPGEDNPDSAPRLTAWGADDLEDHHLIPLAQAKTVNESTRDLRKATDGIGRVLNSPLNRTYVSRSTNRRIGPLSIHQYVKDVTDIAKSDHMIAIPEMGDVDNFEDNVRAALTNRFMMIKTAALNELGSLRKY
ncbi:DUF262 domain-containing protein [Mycobacterium paraintracellulare]|uniref:DUF262 domain-containing protein n=1 Tax=Mycobacterium paraintracellulare TaxID=1138383 RepID=UPI001927ED39|nr:DUF262 domain-containing protein [Mycobacterium paraintracellulare]